MSAYQAQSVAQVRTLKLSLFRSGALPAKTSLLLNLSIRQSVENLSCRLLHFSFKEWDFTGKALG